MKKLLLALMPIALYAGMPAAKADETGLASIHDMRYESGHRVCMTDHFHDGTGNGRTRQQAEAAAKSSWASFTSFEYGSSWGSYALAASKRMGCSQMEHQWTCSTTARPCERSVKSRVEQSQEASR